MQDVTLLNIAQGAAQELFEREKQRVLNNIADPYTEAKAPRSIQLKVAFKPNPERDYAIVEVTVSSKLAATSGTAAPVFIGVTEDENGEPKIVMRQQDIAQKELGLTQPPGEGDE